MSGADGPPAAAGAVVGAGLGIYKNLTKKK